MEHTNIFLEIRNILFSEISFVLMQQRLLHSKVTTGRPNSKTIQKLGDDFTVVDIMVNGSQKWFCHSRSGQFKVSEILGIWQWAYILSKTLPPLIRTPIQISIRHS